MLFAVSRAYIHHTSNLMRMNVIKITWNEFWHYNMRKVGQNSLKQHAKSHSNVSNYNLLQLQVLFGSYLTYIC